MKKIILFSILFVLLEANIGFAANVEYSFPPLQELARGGHSMSLGYLIGRIYQWSLGIAALAAFISIIIAGVRITTSAGNVSTISDARDQIVQALLGLALLFGAYLILHTIDPGLTKLKNPDFDKMKITLHKWEKFWWKEYGHLHLDPDLKKEISKLSPQEQKEVMKKTKEILESDKPLHDRDMLTFTAGHMGQTAENFAGYYALQDVKQRAKEKTEKLIPAGPSSLPGPLPPHPSLLPPTPIQPFNFQPQIMPMPL